VLHYSDNYKISNYKIVMERQLKIKELKEKINELKNLIEDFVDLNHANKNKIRNLQSEIDSIKQNMSKYIDDLEELINQK
tara:strand:+ start:271 stop:510 length:240 start_codon:yes stop_codon:yes gene_type:complete